MAACFLFAPLCGAQAISAGGARCDSPGLAGMGGKSSPARAHEARANAKADRRSGGPAGAPCRAHRQGLPKVWAEICSQPNQSAISGSFFGTKYWKCAESDDGNPKKSMILHRMVPSAPLWPGFRPSDGDYVFMCLAPSFLRSPAVRVTRIY